MGKGSKRGIPRAFGTDEFGFPATPPKVGNVKLSRMEHAKERGRSTWCYPYGFETDNATVKKNTRSWKTRRKTKYKIWTPSAPPRENCMNAADQTLQNWLNTQINSGKRTVTVPADLLKRTTSEGLAEARRLAKLCGCDHVVSA